MQFFEWLVDVGNRYVVNLGISVGDETIPFMVIILLGVGIFLDPAPGIHPDPAPRPRLRRHQRPYDDPDEPGDVSHFQALTTALSATVGIGNIAGVAIAIHWGGPGALFWMWVTAFLGMATKYTEVTLSQKYRERRRDDRARRGRAPSPAGPCTTSSAGSGRTGSGWPSCSPSCSA